MSSDENYSRKKVHSSYLKDVLSPELLKLTKSFQDSGYDIRLVGGVVRDLLLNIPCKDVDLSTNATPDQMKAVFNENGIKYIETGLEHGTLTAHINHSDFEVTTLRYDTEQDGRWAKVVFTNDWKLDAERRDLTINAMSMDTDCTLYDYFDGRDDLERCQVRFVGDARLRIKEDYLRILRYFRFYGRIAADENKHVVEILDVIKETASGLEKIAAERIWMELSKIMIGNFAPSIMKHIYNLGVAKYIGLPDVSSAKFDEFDRVWCNMKNYTPNAVTLLVSLVDNVESVEFLTKALKMSNSEKQLGKFIITHRQLSHNLEFPLKVYQDILVSCPLKSSEQIRHHVIELLYYEGKFDLVKEIAEWKIPQFPVSGNDLKPYMIKPGPKFGKLLNRLKEMWKDSFYSLSKDELLVQVPRLVHDIAI